MKTAYAQHAEHIGKTLPEGWDMVNLEKSVPPRRARGMGIPIEEDPDYHRSFGSTYHGNERN